MADEVKTKRNWMFYSRFKIGDKVRVTVPLQVEDVEFESLWSLKGTTFQHTITPNDILTISKTPREHAKIDNAPNSCDVTLDNGESVRCIPEYFLIPVSSIQENQDVRKS